MEGIDDDPMEGIETSATILDDGKFFSNTQLKFGLNKLKTKF